MNRRLGYRLQLAEVAWPAVVAAEAGWRVASQWRNIGVAPCLPGGWPAFTLKDDQGGLAGVFVDDTFDVRELPVGAAGAAAARPQAKTFRLPFNLKPGDYTVFVSVGARTGTPRLALPLAGDDGQHRYRLGTVRVTAPPAGR
jgi:hypothetical protein